jgi:hypothetical protein
LRFLQRWLWRMLSSGMWRHVDLVWTDVSEELQYTATCSCWFLAFGFFYPEDGGDTFLWNVGSHQIYTTPHPRRWHSSWKWNFNLQHYKRKQNTFIHLRYAVANISKNSSMMVEWLFVFQYNMQVTLMYNESLER